ncbi:phosphoribosylaminoimidazolesuccinocarboxamide synthase [Halorubrum tibetense]|uniref:Phosphoribosylaminoimidazole-succinocarboxamide synthase n=1 Tax=Halorubrum tibetense TaxID=175631 RepID=A0ABD5SE71_9EURY
MTSVKEFRVVEPATPEHLGRGRFAFTDAYSVFDWGRMPDTVPEKGASLCTMGAFNFERLESAGISTHYRGIVDPAAVGAGSDPEDAVVPLADAEGPPTEMAIELTQVPDLPYRGPDAGYDYDAFHAAGGENYLVPLEVVFRNTVPVGSSLRRRVEPAAVGIDADEWPETTVDLPEPVVEFSTKYERQDRYLSRAEADRIAGVADIDALESLAREVNRVVTDRAADAGFVHEDGKIECLYVDGDLRVADVVGTFDENRFSYGGTQVSKEVVRQWYKRAQPEWVEAVSAAKSAVDGRDTDDWRSICNVEPIALPKDVLGHVTDLYAAGANAYTGTDWFDAPPIDDAVAAVEDL